MYTAVSLGTGAPSGQMQGMWSACLGAKTMFQARSYHHVVTPLPPRFVPLENKQAVTYVPARPGLSFSEGLGLDRHSLCLLCDDCDWTCCLNPSITEHLPAGSS